MGQNIIIFKGIFQFSLTNLIEITVYQKIHPSYDISLDTKEDCIHLDETTVVFIDNSAHS